MKKIFLFTLLFTSVFSLQAQSNRTSILQDLENKQPSGQNGNLTATLKTSSRLFGAKDDLTTVILIIPSGSSVAILDSDSTYLHVTFEENEGYIFRRHAVIDKSTASQVKAIQQVPEPQAAQQQQQVSRFTYLENKYGSNMAARLVAGKVWKGMNSEMVKDSWGTPERTNRVIAGNIVKEEWVFKNTWLYFENNSLLDWGPIKR